jgi:hypothetical protein
MDVTDRVFPAIRSTWKITFLRTGKRWNTRKYPIFARFMVCCFPSLLSFSERSARVVSIHFGVSINAEFSHFVSFRNYAFGVWELQFAEKAIVKFLQETFCMVSSRVTASTQWTSALAPTSSGAITRMLDHFRESASPLSGSQSKRTSVYLCVCVRLYENMEIFRKFTPVYNFDNSQLYLQFRKLIFLYNLQYFSIFHNLKIFRIFLLVYFFALYKHAVA